MIRRISNPPLQQTALPRINLLVFLYLSLCFLVLLFDYVSASRFYSSKLSSLTHIDPSAGSLLFPAVVAIAFLIILSMLIARSFHWTRQWKKIFFITKFTIVDWMAVIAILALTMLRLPIPDSSYDTFNYHLYLQTPELRNNVTYNFFPSGIQTYSFPLPDHVFFIFRSLLGYRGGVLLNTLVLLLLFIQVKDLLLENDEFRHFFGNTLFLSGFAAFFIISTEFILANLGIYMIDILAVPFLLEAFRWAAAEKHDPKFVLPYTALLAGLAVSMKFYMVIFAVPLVLTVLIRYFRCVSVKLLIFAGFLGIFTVLPYLLYNFTQTNNPIFPYYNQLFRSPYFPQEYWKDERFGPKNLYETLLWPILIYYQPNRTGELQVYSGRLGLGYLAFIFYCIDGILSRNKKILLPSLIFLTSTFLWITNTGYIRYGSYLEILSGIFIVEVIILLMKSDQKLRVAASGVVLTFFAITLYNGYSLTIHNKADWSLRPTPFEEKAYYLENFKYLFHDYQPIVTGETSDEAIRALASADYWLLLQEDFNSGVLNLVKKDVPIIHLGYIGFSEGSYETFAVMNHANELSTKNKFVISARNMTNVSDRLEQIGYKITAVYPIKLSFYDFRQPVSLIRVTEK